MYVAVDYHLESGGESYRHALFWFSSCPVPLEGPLSWNKTSCGWGIVQRRQSGSSGGLQKEPLLLLFIWRVSKMAWAGFGLLLVLWNTSGLSLGRAINCYHPTRRRRFAVFSGMCHSDKTDCSMQALQLWNVTGRRRKSSAADSTSDTRCSTATMILSIRTTSRPTRPHLCRRRCPLGSSRRRLHAALLRVGFAKVVCIENLANNR